MAALRPQQVLHTTAMHTTPYGNQLGQPQKRHGVAITLAQAVLQQLPLLLTTAMLILVSCHGLWANLFGVVTLSGLVARLPPQFHSTAQLELPTGWKVGPQARKPGAARLSQ